MTFADVLHSYTFVIPASALITGCASILVKSLIKSIHLRLTRAGVEMTAGEILPFPVAV